MKNKKSIVIVLSLVIIIGIIMGVIFNNKETNEDKIIVVTEAGFPPYEFYDDNEIVGVDVEIAKKVAEKLGKKLEIKDVDFDAIINEVKTGKGDFGVGLSITEERLEEVDFSIAYDTSEQVVIVKEDSSITKIEDLNGKKVAVQLGTIADIELTENYPEVEVVQHKKYLLAVEDLLSDKVDAIVFDSVPANETVKKNENLKILDEGLLQDEYGIAVQKGNAELLNAINEVLKELKEAGKIEEYKTKYLGE